MVKSKEKKYLKTFSIHEKDLSLVHQFSQIILQYKHLENILNILIAHEFNNKDNKVLIAAGFLTFSTAFYSIILLGIIYYLFIEKKEKRATRKFFAFQNYLQNLSHPGGQIRQEKTNTGCSFIQVLIDVENTTS